MTIDGGPILQSGHWRIHFKEGYAPTADWFYPANSARAFASGQYDYHGEWWTEWFDTDDNSDGIEDESFIRHFMSDRKQLQNCNNSIGIKVFNKKRVACEFALFTYVSKTRYSSKNTFTDKVALNNPSYCSISLLSKKKNFIKSKFS